MARGRIAIQTVSLRVIINLMDANFNPDKQHTLNQATSISGTGLHTGINVDMTLRSVFNFSVLIWPEDPLLRPIVTW